MVYKTLARTIFQIDMSHQISVRNQVDPGLFPVNKVKVLHRLHQPANTSPPRPDMGTSSPKHNPKACVTRSGKTVKLKQMLNLWFKTYMIPSYTHARTLVHQLQLNSLIEQMTRQELYSKRLTYSYKDCFLFS